MPPNNFEEVPFVQPLTPETEKSQEGPFKATIKWPNALIISFFHLGALYTLLFVLYRAKFLTVAFAAFLVTLGGVGVTGGAHRLWAHRSYKANLPLKLILLLWYTTAGLNTVFDWVRDHRTHHKFSDTDADPHNINRGFFYAHVGWLMHRKHPEVFKKSDQVDMSDLLQDPVLNFHTKYFYYMMPFICFIIPPLIPIYGWGEDTYISIMVLCFLRYVIGQNIAFSINSFGHTYGYKPYDTRITPTENPLVAFIAFGEGWHNYHHTFPWDYRAAEIGTGKNLTALVIDFFAKIGWAYDLKSVSAPMVKNTMDKHGDGTQVHPNAAYVKQE